MPSLKSKDVHKFWHDHHDKAIYKAVALMESVENWTVDDNSDLEKLLEQLGKELDKMDQIELQEEDRIIKIGVSIKTGRMLRLLQCIDVACPGAASKIFNVAKSLSKSSDDVYGVFLRRNIVFERMRVLSRVFSEERISDILKVVTASKGEIENDM